MTSTFAAANRTPTSQVSQRKFHEYYNPAKCRQGPREYFESTQHGHGTRLARYVKAILSLDAN
jgi:hypothetical protein